MGNAGTECVTQRTAQREDQPVHDEAAFLQVLEDIRARGFALRSPTVRPVSNTLALPIFQGLTEGEQIDVVGALTQFVRQQPSSSVKA